MLIVKTNKLDKTGKVLCKAGNLSIQNINRKNDFTGILYSVLNFLYASATYSSLIRHVQ
jgi:hypothetical protein